MPMRHASINEAIIAVKLMSETMPSFADTQLTRSKLALRQGVV